MLSDTPIAQEIKTDINNLKEDVGELKTNNAVVITKIDHMSTNIDTVLEELKEHRKTERDVLKEIGNMKESISDAKGDVKGDIRELSGKMKVLLLILAPLVLVILGAVAKQLFG